MAPIAVEPSPAPPTVVGPTTKKATRPTNQIPQYLIEEARVQKEPFNPQRHLNFQPPSKIHTMKEIGLEGHGISLNAVSEPFPLFTEDAIKQIRAEIFSEPVLQKCQYTSSFTKNMIRGMGHELAPFTYNAWYSAEVLARISEVAGVELVPSMDYEVANINISFNDSSEELAQGADSPNGDDLPAVAWHYDSFPFVCVTMLSDCTEMIGGETALRKPNGEVMKVRGPSMGTAVVMQGRYIEHQAIKALGGRERISMVTAFRPKSPFIKDESVLTGVRPISNISETYTQYTIYRLEVLEERLRARLKMERRREVAKHDFDLASAKSFLMEQKQFLESMLTELVEI
ncbi:hypothetical protein BO71DRAFT_349585 [Aspergillus ellipticus CBS 707.79]|uniref:Fe2OG dioxygenase domain-containing protein n=1 Tax=Aspergillus ellipticus CBS 707.79 TaxID=1448320 RepID=A0A319DQ65_9EURO|nr:hypothetical protein BO71DRAFT_349585 [Aspergillus ellipticus CBS 707.79]